MGRKVGVHRRRRKPGEAAGLRVSVRNHCLACMGYVASEVPLCTSPGCWLYLWRLGKTPQELRRKLTPAQREAAKRAGERLAEAARSAREIGCSAGVDAQEPQQGQDEA